MKKKIILIVSIVLLLAMSVSVFVACNNSSSDFSKFIKETTYTSDVQSTTTFGDFKMTENNDVIKMSSNKHAVIVKENGTAELPGDKWFMLSVTSGKAIELLDEPTLMTQFGVWSVYDNVSKSYNIIDSDAITIVTVKNLGSIAQVNSNSDVKVLKTREIPDKFFYIQNSKCISALSTPLNSSLFENSAQLIFGKNVIVNYSITTTTSSIAIYDSKTFAFKDSYNFSSLISSAVIADNTFVHLLSDQTVVLQIQTDLPSDAKKYDYIQPSKFGVGMQKVDVATYKIDVIKGTAKEIDFKYVLGGDAIKNIESDGDAYNSKVENYCTAFKFEKNALSMTENIVAFDNDLNVKFDGSKSKELSGFTEVRQVGENVYLLNSKNGQKFVNGKGELISHLINITLSNPYDNIVYGVGIRLDNGDLYSFPSDGAYSSIFESGRIADLVPHSVQSVGEYTYYSVKVRNELGVLTGKEVCFKQKGAEPAVKIDGEVTSPSTFKDDGFYVVMRGAEGAEIGEVFNAYTGELIVSAEVALFQSVVISPDGTTAFVVDGILTAISK